MLHLAMGLNVFEACRGLGVGKLVAACSVCAYPKFTPVPFGEDDLWDGYPEESNAPYGLAKKMLIVLSDAYRRQYGLDSCVPVIANLYGPEDNFDLEDSHVIAATRLGTDVETRIRDLAGTICEVVGYQGKTVWDTSRPDGQPVRYLDVSRARELIGFEARMPLDEGLRRTVESFRSSSAVRSA